MRTPSTSPCNGAAGRRVWLPSSSLPLSLSLSHRTAWQYASILLHAALQQVGVRASPPPLSHGLAAPSCPTQWCSKPTIVLLPMADPMVERLDLVEALILMADLAIERLDLTVALSLRPQACLSLFVYSLSLSLSLFVSLSHSRSPCRSRYLRQHWHNE